jgi:hypothetical protein
MISTNWRLRMLGILLSASFTGAASAITVDGTLDAGYGSAVSVQTVDTEFGNANPPGNLGGSELNAAYAKVESGRLFLMLTGNHEPNFNKLDIFIDTGAGGENTLSGTPGYDFNGGGGWISQNLSGLTFDAGFNAGYHLFSRWGSGTGPYEVDFVNRAGGGSFMVPGASASSPNAAGLIAAGSIPAGDVGPNASGSSLTQNLDFAINNNNAAGVGGGSGAANQANALAVTTGMEFSIDLADLGNPAPGTVLKIFAAINNGDHNYLSNQLLGGLPAPAGNLGGNGSGGFIGNLSGVNLANIGGDQFFRVLVPEPVSLVSALVGLGLLTLRRRTA